MALLCAGSCWWGWHVSLFKFWDHAAQDWAQNQFQTEAIEETPLVYVKIGDIADQPWPWPSLDYAILAHSLSRFHPKVVVFEVPVPKVEPSTTAYDIQLKNQLKRLNLLILSVPVRTTGITLGEELSPRPFATLPENPSIPAYGSGIWPLNEIREVSRLHLQAYPADPDGLVRRIPLIINYQGRSTASQVLAAYAAYRGADIAASGVVLGQSIRLKNKAGEFLESIPVNHNGELTLKLRRDSTHLRKEVEFYSVILAAEEQYHAGSPSFDLGVLRQSLVLVGRENAYSVESLPTPTGTITPARLQLNALSNLIQRDYLQPITPLAMSLLLLLSAFTGIGCSRLLNAVGGLIVLLFVGGLLVGGSVVFFVHWNFLIDPSAPLVCLVVSWWMGRTLLPYFELVISPEADSI